MRTQVIVPELSGDPKLCWSCSAELTYRELGLHGQSRVCISCKAMMTPDELKSLYREHKQSMRQQLQAKQMHLDESKLFRRIPMIDDRFDSA